MRPFITACLVLAMTLSAVPVSAAGGTYRGLTRSAIVSTLGAFALVSFRTVQDGHGGSLTAAQGISPNNAHLSRFAFWHGTKNLRVFDLFDAEITQYAPNRVTLRVGDVPAGPSAYFYMTFHWNGARLIASRPLPRQKPMSAPLAPKAPAQAGFLGVEFQDPPSDWTVTGCEIVHVLPGTPAAAAGLIGAQDRLDPVGDVIYGLSLNGSYASISNCLDLTTALATTQAGEPVEIYFYHRVVNLLVGSWTAETTTAVLGTQPCPPPITGSITSQFFGNRINLQIKLAGPSGSSQPMTAILDTGGVNTNLPNALLQQLGFTPFMVTVGGGIVPGATDTEYLYLIPASDLLVQDNGSYVPLATGELLVTGIPGLQGPGVGPDILKHGASFSASGSTWSLTPACSY